MKLKHTFEMIELDGQTLAVPVETYNDTDPRSMIRLNETAAFIFELLKNDVTEDEITDKILSEYSGDRNAVAGYVHRFVAQLESNGVLE